MDLRQLELFTTLMRVGTTTETARVLGISQPAVSGHLRSLERQLGFALFHRIGNRLEPTAEARTLFDEAGPILATHRRVRDRIEFLRMAAASPVSVAATPALLEGYLVPRLRAAGFNNWRRRLRLRVSEPEVDVRGGRAEIGLQQAVPAKAEFHAEVVARTPLCVVVRRDHALARASRVQLAEIAGEPLVSYDPNWSPMGAAIQRACLIHGLPFERACEVPFCATVCQMVSACGGVGVIDGYTRDGLTDPALAVLDCPDLGDIAVVAFYCREVPLRAAAQDLWQVLTRS